MNNLEHKNPSATAVPHVGGADTELGLARMLIGAFIMFCPAALLRAQQVPPVNADSEFRRPGLMTPSSTLPRKVGYLVCPDDQLEIYIPDVPELSRQFRVDSNGLLTLPLLAEPISAAGLTLADLSRTIGGRLRQEGMVANADVNLFVKESPAHSITISGAVKKPDVYPLYGKTTLLDALSQAGGLADDAGNIAIINRGGIAVPRIEAGSDSGDRGVGALGQKLDQTETLDLNRLLDEGDTSRNLELYPGDRITVQRAGIVYVVGAVKRAGGFALKDDQHQMTVLKALALAEYLTSTAVAKKAMIVRRNRGQSEEIPVNLASILSGHAHDRPLQANDILFVPDSSSRKALHRAAEAVAQGASILVYRVP